MTSALDRVTTTTAGQQQSAPTVGSMIQALRPELQRALPRGMDADRLARIALTLVRKDPLLAQCKPESFAGALLTAASLGLEPGINGEAYLVPYKKECTLIVGYQGFAKLFWQHPLAMHLDAQAVRANDDFDYGYGLEPFLVHQPAKGERGEIVYYYAVAKLTTGASAFVVLTPEDVKALRGGKEGPSGTVADPMHWMERKTALRQLVKMLPRSTSMNRALEVDDKPGTELQREQVAQAAIEAPIHADPITGEVVEPADRGETTQAPLDRGQTAQDMANEAAQANQPNVIRLMYRAAEHARLLEEVVSVEDDAGPLGEYLTHRENTLRGEQQSEAGRAEAESYSADEQPAPAPEVVGDGPTFDDARAAADSWAVE